MAITLLPNCTMLYYVFSGPLSLPAYVPEIKFNNNIVVVVVRLGHSPSFIDSFDNKSTASGPASCRLRRPPGNAVSGHSSTMCLVI